VDILNDSNIMDHCFAITLNCHLELMQWQVKKKHIAKLKT
jgi:hypothetical protein